MKPMRSELAKLYGSPIDEKLHMGFCHVPLPLQAAFKNRHIYCNLDIIEPLSDALGNILARKCEHLVTSFDGCFNQRLSRVDARPSVHSWGMAIDLNAATNALGTPGDIAPELVKCFTDAGFVWGGSWHRKDCQHFQYVIEL